MSGEKLFIICVTLVILAITGSTTYYNIQEATMMSRNIENAIVKGVDPIAVRCAYSPASQTCAIYASKK